MSEESNATQEQPKKELAPLKCYYMVGLREDGQFAFEINGTNQGMIELLGLHDLAGIQIKAVTDSKLGFGDALTFKLAQAINEVLQKLQQVNNAVEPVVE